jgi:hypothetical protein
MLKKIPVGIAISMGGSQDMTFSYTAKFKEGKYVSTMDLPFKLVTESGIQINVSFEVYMSCADLRFTPE